MSPKNAFLLTVNDLIFWSPNFLQLIDSIEIWALILHRFQKHSCLFACARTAHFPASCWGFWVLLFICYFSLLSSYVFSFLLWFQIKTHFDGFAYFSWFSFLPFNHSSFFPCLLVQAFYLLFPFSIFLSYCFFFLFLFFGFFLSCSLHHNSLLVWVKGCPAILCRVRLLLLESPVVELISNKECLIPLAGEFRRWS